jgi:thioredoxin 1
MVPPILKQVKSTLGERVQIIKIDVDKNPELAKKYNIRSVPTLMIFRNGKVEWSQAGVAQANDLIKALQFLN